MQTGKGRVKIINKCLAKELYATSTRYKLYKARISRFTDFIVVFQGTYVLSVLSYILTTMVRNLHRLVCNMYHCLHLICQCNNKKDHEYISKRKNYE
uniref:Uncharacterized protein n=1 Tax=Arundo donax TaxID=35708 RepID=A0A0A9HRZ9_ARUDO